MNEMSVFSYTVCAKSSTFASDLKIQHFKLNFCIMKKMMMILSAAVLALTGCTNEPGMKTAIGDYTYRTSGTARIYFQENDSATHVTLESETGTLRIARGTNPNSAIMTVYADNGETYELPLLFAHDTIWVEGEKDVYRDIEVKMDGGKELFHIRIGGEGQVLDNGDLTIGLGYSGRSRNTDHPWALTAGDVHMNCKKQ